MIMKPILHYSKWAVLLVISQVLVVRGGEHEYRLTKYLLGNYEPSVRPAENASAPVNVTFDMSIHHIIDVDEKNQVLTMNCWLTQIWRDAHLTWNYTDFGGIKSLRLPIDKVWKPDIILYNNADSGYNTAVINTNVIVDYKGEVTWLSHGIYRSSCSISVEYFPFDVQICPMKWSSWTYDGKSLDVFPLNESGELSNYQQNGEFNLDNYTAEKHTVYYSCCPDAPYPDITYYIILRRRPLFYVFNLILPCVLINGIALLVFYVPSESGEKVTLGISALLSMTVFLMTIRESLPPTEETPLITLYYGVSICLVSFASALAVVTLNIHHRGYRGDEVPKTVKSVILGYMARALFLHFDPTQHTNSRTGDNNTVDTNHKNTTNNLNLKKLNDVDVLFDDDSSGNGDGGRGGMTLLTSNNVNSGGSGPNAPGGGYHKVNPLPPSHHSMPAGADPCQANSQQQVYLLNQQQQQHSPLVGYTTQHHYHHHNTECCRGNGGSVHDLNMAHNNHLATSSPQNVKLRRSSEAANEFHHFCGCYDPRSNSSFCQVMSKVSYTIDRSEKRHTDSDQRDQTEMEWKQVSMVIDRFLLLIFFLAMTIASLVILTSSPHISGAEVKIDKKNLHK